MNPFHPAAGDTPAPSDPVELAIARRAAQVVWRAVPYFAFRYGERGRRFGLSDGAWLLTLADMPRAVRLEQVDWLARVLSSRGIPSWLLELQLITTARLGRRRGWNGAGAMADAARHLGDRRRSVLSDDAFEEAGARLSYAPMPRRLATGTGKLVASALVDAALGVSASPAPTLDWLQEPSRFAPELRRAIEDTRAFVEARMGHS